MAEVDISKKVQYGIRYGLAGLIIIAIVISGIAWYFAGGRDVLTIRDAKVATNMVACRTLAAGTVTEILVKDGDRVEAGDVVARIKVNVTDEQIKQLEQTVELSKRNLEQIKKGVTVQKPAAQAAAVQPAAQSGASSAEVARTKNRMERLDQLYKMGAVSAVERDAAVSDYQAALASATPAAHAVSSNVAYETVVQAATPEQIKGAELQVRQAEAALQAARNSSAATEIKAMTSGTAYTTDFEVGSEVRAGDVIVNIGDASSLWVEAYIEPGQISKVSVGQLAEYTIDKKDYSAAVTEIVEPEGDTVQENTEGGYSFAKIDKVTLKISIPKDALNKLHPGQKAEVHLR